MHSFKNIPLFLTLFLLGVMASCHPKINTIPGHYESVDYNIFQYAWVYLGNGRFVYPLGSRIHLYKNDSFTYSTCAITTKGHWEAVDDTLYLYGETAIWNVDSLQEHSYNGKWPEVSEQPLTFAIKRNHLYSRGKVISMNDKNGEVKSYENKNVPFIQKLYKVDGY